MFKMESSNVLSEILKEIDIVLTKGRPSLLETSNIYLCNYDNNSLEHNYSVYSKI